MAQNSFSTVGPAFYLVATPIGNLQDISDRVRMVLKKVSYVFCEDTRRTSKLLTYLQIKKPLISYHQFNAKLRQPKIMQLLTAGYDLALLSDAGSPVISDPGHLIVKAAIKNKFKVIAVGINCAAVHGLICAGFKCDRFYFRGFLPRTHQQRTKQLHKIANYKHPVVFYESRYRILGLLTDIKTIYPQAQLFVGRELTKINEWMSWGSAAQVLQDLQLSSQKGEYVVVLRQKWSCNNNSKAQWQSTLKLLMDNGIKRSQAKLIIKKINY